ncbi:MAG: hypothetical protein Ct9H300mP26_1080 [Acidimicrobiales bacterium]|nr:MAG: hypothetical protein Ct9H300mP26_1080 [Acidimicrobiales bacterium]
MHTTIRIAIWKRNYSRPVQYSSPQRIRQDYRGKTELLAALISNADAFAATSLLKDLASTLKLEFQLTNVDGLAGLHPTRGAKINIGDTEVGSLGEVDPAVLQSYEIEDRCAWLNLRLDLVIEAAISVEGVPYQPVSTFPSSDVDLAFAVGEQVQASEIEMTLGRPQAKSFSRCNYSMFFVATS